MPATSRWALETEGTHVFSRPNTRKSLQADQLYCSKNLKIHDKAGNILPFEWNEAQRLLHAKVEEQLTLNGWVRVIVLKGDSRA